VPWETLIAVLLVLGGITEIVEPGAVVSVANPRWVALTISIVYIAAGVAMLLGLWRAWLRIEMAGLILLLVVEVGRTGAAIFYDSPRLSLVVVTFVAVCWAAGLQLYQLFQGRVVVQVEAIDEAC
jgi:hypothetical protein